MVVDRHHLFTTTAVLAVVLQLLLIGAVGAAPTSSGCTVSLSKRISHTECIENTNFGCYPGTCDQSSQICVVSPTAERDSDSDIVCVCA